MRHRGLSILLSALVLAACQGVPDDTLRPRATIAGSHADIGASRIDTFRVTAIDGHPVGRTEEPMKTFGVDAVEQIPAGRSVRIEFEGLARYGNPAKSLFWDPMLVEGSVDFVPEPNARYVVRGEIGEKDSTVWLEVATTREIVARKFVAPRKDAATAPLPGSTL